MGDRALQCKLFVEPRKECAALRSDPLPFDPAVADAEVESVRRTGAKAEVILRTHQRGQIRLELGRVGGVWKILTYDEGPPASLADDRALRQVSRVTLAVNAYADAHGGSFTGVTMADLRKQNPSISGRGKITGTQGTYRFAISSESGNVFRTSGRLFRPGAILCKTRGVGRCPSSGRLN